MRLLFTTNFSIPLFNSDCQQFNGLVEVYSFLPMAYSRFHYILITCSALLYGFAYLASGYLWWTTLFFLVFLFYEVINKRIILLDGIIWSTIAFSLHLFGVLEGLFFVAQGPFLQRMALPALALLTAFIYGVGWFAALTWICKLAGFYVRLSFSVIITWLFFLFLEHACLSILGRIEGYLLFSPLIPLVEYPFFLHDMPKIGPAAFLLVFIAIQALISSALIHIRYKWILVLGIMSCAGLIVLFIKQNSHLVNNYNELVCGAACFAKNDSVTYTGKVIRNYCKALLERYPQTGIVVFPESAIGCHFLPGEPQIVALCNAQELGKAVTILVGGFRWDNCQYRNTVYWIHNGKLIDLFDKRHTMALTERVPGEYFLGKISLIKESYFKEFAGINASSCQRPRWRISETMTVIPYICSELYFNAYPDHKPCKNEHLLALCNDKWIKRNFIRYQMLMGARFRAIQWQVPVLYVAYFYQALCMPDGRLQKLNVYDQQKK